MEIIKTCDLGEANRLDTVGFSLEYLNVNFNIK